MPTLQSDGAAPYAPSKTLIDVLERNRSAGLPQPVTVDSIQRVSVPGSLAPRVIQALKMLDLIDSEGRSTPQLDKLRRASTPEFKPMLVEHLKAIYGVVFAVVDPAAATYQQVHDAFRQFTPHGQIDRMVALFLGLLEYAEYSDQLPRARVPQSAAGPGSIGKPRPAVKTTAVKTTAGPPVKTVARRPSSHGSDTPPSAPATAQEDGSRQPRASEDGHSTSIDLGDAGTVILTVAVNPILLTKTDRDYLYSVIDKLAEWRSSRSSDSPASGSQDRGQ